MAIEQNDAYVNWSDVYKTVNVWYLFKNETNFWQNLSIIS